MITSLTAAKARRRAHLLELPAAIFAFFARRMERRSAIASLESLSDHQLRDIGISRADISNAVELGRRFD